MCPCHDLDAWHPLLEVPFLDLLHHAIPLTCLLRPAYILATAEIPNRDPGRDLTGIRMVETTLAYNDIEYSALTGRN